MPKQLLDLAAKPSPRPGKSPGTRDEVLYALWDMNKKDPRFKRGGSWAAPNPTTFFSDDVKTAVENRYLRLAASNHTHFVVPRGPKSAGRRGSAGGSYRALHENAIANAYGAAKRSQPIDPALALEAGAQHFLTDAFSSGHLRVPRRSIEDHSNQIYPTSGQTCARRSPTTSPAA